MSKWKKYSLLFVIICFSPSLNTNIAYAKKVKDYMTVVCIKPFPGGTFFGGASAELHACDQLYCGKGKTKKYKNHKFCEGGEYSKMKHAHLKSGEIKLKIICVNTGLIMRDPEGLCSSNLE